MQPVIALVGRPNVGKSTLFNRLTRSRDAIVANMPGLTRDRQYGEGSMGERRFIAIDTGGITGHEAGIDAEMAAQSLQAIAEATVCLFLVDAQHGIAPDDDKILDHLRRTGKPFFLVVNKVDGMDPDQACAEFHSMGVPGLYPITASQGRGVRQLIDEVLAAAPEKTLAEAQDQAKGVKIAVAGRPNVGKSTLVNRMLGEERVVVYDQPGTTRDSVYVPYERRGKSYTLIDTAGIRRRGKTKATVEKFSVVKSLQSIKDAHVVILLVDARQGIVEQDLHLLGYVLETGRALVIAINKWDGMDAEEKDQVKAGIRRRFTFVDFANIHYISALHGTGVGEIYKSVDKAYHSATRDLATNALTRILQDTVIDHAPPTVNGRRIKLRYAHAGGHNPPTIVIHGKQTAKLPAHYSRYLEKSFRKALQLEGTPVRIELRSDDNPFTRKEKNLTPQQVAQKRRISKNRGSSRAAAGGRRTRSSKLKSGTPSANSTKKTC